MPSEPTTARQRVNALPEQSSDLVNFFRSVLNALLNIQYDSVIVLSRDEYIKDGSGDKYIIFNRRGCCWRVERPSLKPLIKFVLR